MPKCSGPTAWTRGWMAPLGLWISEARRVRRPRAVARVAMIDTLSRSGLGMPDSHKVVRQGGEKKILLSDLATYQGSGTDPVTSFDFPPPIAGPRRWIRDRFLAL